MTLYFFGGKGIKTSYVNVGFVGTVARVRSERVKKFLEVTFVRENTYTSQVECIMA